MNLYDEVITTWLNALPDSYRELELNESWPESDAHEMVLRSDMAYELGSDFNSGLGATAITSNNSFVNKDEVIVYGKDLNEINKDTPYARLSIIKVADDKLGEGNILYNYIRKIEYVKYHMNPKGYMIRISASSEKERVRVSKEALNNGISFASIGKRMIDEYHKNKEIEAVKLIFITLEDFDYKSLMRSIRKAEDITKTIDHILKNATMDCQSCSLQKICEEVEGMKELHFGMSKQG